MNSFKCKCDYEFPDITISFNHDEILTSIITVICPKCREQYSQEVEGKFIS